MLDQASRPTSAATKDHHLNEVIGTEELKLPPFGPQGRLPIVVSGSGHYLGLDDGRTILDGCGGAAVACLGHGRPEVFAAMAAQAKEIAYVPWAFFESNSTRKLCDWLVQSTGGKMSKVYLMSSGT
jgi:adenosylmethionine-8-amino-7-oxononanoate aminotransferase